MKFAQQGDGDGKGLPVILIHGFGSNRESWVLNVPALGARRRVFAIDLPGHGETPGPVSEEAAGAIHEAVVDWAASMRLERFHLVGLSMGAAIAQAAALAAPERVASLALLSSVVLGKLDQPFMEGFLAAHDPQAMRPWIEMLFADPALVTPELIDDLVRYKNMPGTDADLWAYARTVLGEASLSDLARRFEELAMPTLVLFGDQDRVTPPPSVMPPGSILVTGAGHMPHIEAASRVNALLSEFMARND